MGTFRQQLKAFMAAVLVLLLSACSHQAVVEDNFPQPITRQLDRQVTLYLTPELLNYVHKEKPDSAARWTVDIRAANATLFETVLQGMFTDVTVVETLEGVADDAIVITPVMREYQFSTPGMSKSKYYEVWIKYALQLSQPKARQLMDWHIIAYGREEKSGKSASQAMEKASRRAMRDAAAEIVVNLMNQPAARQLFENSAQQIPAQSGSDKSGGVQGKAAP